MLTNRGAFRRPVRRIVKASDSSIAIDSAGTDPVRFHVPFCSENALYRAMAIWVPRLIDLMAVLTSPG